MLKSTGALVVSLRGGRRPRDLALAIVLGLLIGVTGGWNLSCGLLLAIGIFLNVPTSLLIAGALAGGAFAWIASDLTQAFGVILLDETGLGRAVAAMGEGPIAALLGWDSYAFAGGAAIALAFGVPVALMAAVVAAHRTRGTEMIATPWRRPRGLPFALAAAAAVMATPWWLGPRLARDELLRRFSQYNSAEVSAADVQLSLWTGKFAIRDLRIADPAHLERDRLRVGRVVGQLAPGQLIRGRLHVGSVSLEHVRADTPRREPARGSDDASEPAETAPLHFAGSHDEGRIEIDTYLHDWPTVRRDLAWLEWLASGVERLADAETDDEPAGIENSVLRSDLGARKPRVVIHRLSAADLGSPWRLGRKSLLEVTELTSDPRTSNKPTCLRLVVPQLAGELNVQFDLRGGKRRHALKCSAYQLDLARLTGSAAASTAGLGNRGATYATGEGWLDRRGLELPLQVEMQPHDLPLEGPGQFAGIDHNHWRQIASRLERLRLDTLLSGPWTAPKLTMHAGRLVEQVQHQLRAAGAHDLVLAIEDQGREQGGEVIRASASESEASLPGVCQLSDEDLSPRTPPELMSSTAVTGRQGRDDAEAPSYPSTSTPYSLPPDDPLASRESPRTEEPPTESIASSPTGPQSFPSTRSAALPGPVNLFVGSDPIAVSTAPASAPAALASNRTSPVMPPAWPGEAPEADLGAASGDQRQPGTVVRHSFLARWSGALRERFQRASRVPEPEPLDEQMPPTAPPAFDVPPTDAPQFDAPGMPSAASQPWYKRMWR